MGTGLEVLAYAAIASAVAGAGASAYSAHEQRKAAKAQEKLQREANAKQEAIAKEQAGATPQQRQAQEVSARKERMRSGLRQSILTSQSNSGTKLGD